ncbi:P-loop containing nucleoside triphosphate hydrolase protein [Mycena albidolilacea]|uniref:DNA 3'-5' helicase n=1 Tax=Mycena albidolilacea TaxID=1033008 RepID=A0AAD7AK60_9AGAR|nr:P-loop containing nucleoside triphosphate hydrolase protein [Mycena albidolilacea]
MLFCPVTNPDPACVQRANECLCHLWNVLNLRPHQEQASINMIKGVSTLLDFPTSGSKTLTFWWPLLYHWAPNDDTEETRKNLLVISPLVALMGEQANDLIQRGIPAIVLTSETPNLEQALKDFGLNKSCVAFVSPEMAIGKSFHQHVLKSEVFQANNIGLVIDELHAVDEWGTEDFQVAYSELATLIKCLPTGVPLMMASATLPPILRTSVIYKLGVSTNYDHLAFSNTKPNIGLSVRILQHKLGSYADLLPLFLENTAGAAEFPQTLIYVNSRKEAEEIQDSLQHHCPEAIPVVAFEFYHRYIAESQKVHIQENIRDGTLRGVPTTDALRVGINFSHIKCVVLWREPRTFLSLIQKARRCVHMMSDRGEGILFVTRASYAQHLANLEAEGEGSDAESNTGEPDDAPEVQAAEGEQMDREAAVKVADEDEGGESVPVDKCSALSAFEAQDRLFLSCFIVTSQCHRKPWSTYFKNDKKKPFFKLIPGAPCCDNCNPDLFEVDAVAVVPPARKRPGRGSKPTAELTTAVTDQLDLWRSVKISRDFPRQSIIIGKLILPNKVIEKSSEWLQAVTTPDIFFSSIEWKWGTHDNCKYGNEVVTVIGDILQDHPDAEQDKRDAAQREKVFLELTAKANKQLHEKHKAIFQECWDAVYNITTEKMVSRGRGATK